MGNMLRIFQLCTKSKDFNTKLEMFMSRLLNRGHQQSFFLPLFDKAIANATTYLEKCENAKLAAALEQAEAAERRVYLHVPYRPDNPPPSKIQSLWHQHVAEPLGQLPLNKMKNLESAEVPADKMIITYHRAPKLDNILSYRKVANQDGPKVSSYL
ncbi:hypothetical protein ACHAXR_008163 [Thalassiosira sp. AJA248-18]